MGNQQSSPANVDLIEAVKIGDVAAVSRCLVNVGSLDKDYRDENGSTALTWAADKGHTEIVGMLLQAGANVNGLTQHGVNALVFAATKGHVAVTKLLVDAGADTNNQSKAGSSALTWAAEKGYLEIVKILVKGGATVDLPTETGHTALIWAAQNGHAEVVAFLLASGAKVNHCNEKGSSALTWSAENGHKEAARVLLEHGADVNIATKTGVSALMYAARKGHQEIALMLLKAGATVNARSANGLTALTRATQEGYAPVVKLLLEWGAEEAKTEPAKALNTPNIATTSKIPKVSVIETVGQVASAPTKPINVETATIACALQQGSKEWRRSKFSVVGEGRAGKTAFTNAVVGKTFEETLSTVGINQLTCDVKHVSSNAGEQQWAEGKRDGREYETALAQMVRMSKLPGGDKKTKGDDIRDYMKAAGESVLFARTAGSAAKAATAIAAAQQQVAPVGAGAAAFEAVTKVKAAQVPAAANSDRKIVAGDDRADASGAHRATAPHTAAARVSLTSKKVVPVAVTPISSINIDHNCAYDEEMIMKMLATMKDEDSGLLISLFDFGGQAVFDVIHHLFLTRNGVYALVFNMEWLTHDGPEKDKALRFMRSWLSSIAVHTFDKATQMTAPIVLVGTRLDLVPSPAVHAMISTLLHENFSDNLAWRSVLENENGHDSNGKAIQCFFPVDNKLGKKGDTMKQLMSVVHGAIENAAYTHKQVPLTWFKLIDRMNDTKKDCLALSEVSTIAAQCGVTEPEVLLFLAFLNDMGHLMWLNEPELRDVVILDPISYLVTPATIIICKLHPEQDDPTHHSMVVHRECAKLRKQEWTALGKNGVLNTKLLPILWKEYFEHSHVLLLLMVKFGLLVPLRGGGKSPEENQTVCQYLVPTLLTPAPIANSSLLNWSADGEVSSCYFVFTLGDELEFKSTIMEADLKSMGFLPSGMFERLVGRALSWSQDTAKGSCIDLHSVMLHKDMAVLSFGRQRFRLVHCAAIHCVRVDIEGKNPIAVQQKLLDLITKIMDECMKSLCCFPAVTYCSIHASEDSLHGMSSPVGLQKDLLPEELLIPLQQLRNVTNGGSMLTWRGGRTLLNASDIKNQFRQWLQLYDLRERYDVFISYRWSDRGKPQYDSDFTAALFDMFTNFSVGEQNRAVEVFLDRKRLQDGRLFTVDFAAALSNTLVAVPVITMEALSRMLDHSPDRVDNVLLEWTMMIECFAAKRILKVYPILFGARQSTDTGVTVTNFFSNYSQLQVPKVVPSATLEQAAKLLRANNVPLSAQFASYTVHSILAEMQLYLLCKASDYAHSELVEAFAGNVVDLLSKCGTEELNKVVMPVAAAAHSHHVKQGKSNAVAARAKH